MERRVAPSARTLPGPLRKVIPAEYRVTGVKTFMVSYDGIVYEKDMGPDSLNLAKNMERYNPDKTWHRTDDQWPADLVATAD